MMALMTSTRVNGHFRRIAQISLAVHLGGAALYLFFPRDAEPTKPLMTISLGGGVGERTTGMTPIAGREIEKVAPPPKRPEPVKPTPPTKPDVMKVPAKTTPAKETKASEDKTPPPPPDTRPPTTGAEVKKGSSPAETGATGQSKGITVGGGADASAELPSNFCCMAYANEMVRKLNEEWRNRKPGPTGMPIVSFTIHRDGTVKDITLVTPSGSPMLDIISVGAVRAIRLDRLPPQYPNETLTIVLKFPYKGP
jgi:TonB family protein